MGNITGTQIQYLYPQTNTVTINNLSEMLEKATKVSTQCHQGYGQLHTVEYRGRKLHVGESGVGTPPPQRYLHWLVYPSKVVVMPEYIPFEKMNANHYGRLKGVEEEQKVRAVIELLKDVCGVIGEGIGLSWGRLAYADGWKLMGQNNINHNLWNYNAILNSTQDSAGLYLSPELMRCLSKQKLYPSIDVAKSDVFVLGVILLEIATGENLHPHVYSYEKCAIYLKPLLKSLHRLKKCYGEFLYQLLVRMLELEVNERVGVDQIVNEVNKWVIGNSQREELDQTKTNSIQNQQIEEKNTRSLRRISDVDRSPGAIRKNFRSNLSPIPKQSNRQKHTQSHYHGVIINRSPLKTQNRKL